MQGCQGDDELMAGFLSAHGYDPGPTQRPLLAGAISGALAAIPAVAVLWAFGSIKVEAQILGVGVGTTLALGFPIMAVAGAIYCRLFGRAANNLHGGWLFGMAFAFALWAAGAAFILPIVSGGSTPAGRAAVGVFASLLVWGFGLGIINALIHPYLHERIETASESTDVGPRAAASNGGDPRRGQARSK
jgi:hypothetical protein